MTYPSRDQEHPNWNLFAARMDGDPWTGPIRLTSDPLRGLDGAYRGYKRSGQ